MVKTAGVANGLPTGGSEWQAPERFEEYRILRLLGAGGMGAVYLAEDTLLERRVAIKFVSSGTDEGAHERFLREARAAARLKHPNVVTVHRVGSWEGRPYIVSELIRGTALDKLARPVPWKRVAEIGLGLARGLAAAHRHGVLHRDIKPANAMLSEEGEPILLDFGLAKVFDQSPSIGAPPDAPTSDRMPIAAPPNAPTADRVKIAAPPNEPTSDAPASFEHPSGPELTVAGRVMGTPLYLAPEAWMGYPATPRTDVYAFGVVLFELLTGKPPHVDAPPSKLPFVVIQTDAPRIAGLLSGIDPRLAEIVDRCLRRNPAERYPTAEEVRDALAEIAAPTREVATVPQGNPYRGLLPFEAQHRSLFFGRSADIRDAVERLRSETFVLVAGASGVGKSSLCRAGVVPQIEADRMEGREWSTITLVPGVKPAAALAAAIAPRVGLDEATFARELAGDPAELVRRIRLSLGASRGLLLFVDQLEELATVSQAESAASVARFLAEIADQPAGLRLLATVRADFLAPVATLAGLGSKISRALLLLRPLSEDGVRETIVGPARATGVRFESDAMVDGLVRSAVKAEGGLPLLEFTLAELWERRDPATNTITGTALEKVGGVEGALARHADSVIAAMLPEERAAARRAMLRLVSQELTRARRTAGELGAMEARTRAALESLVDGRLLVAHEVEGETSYEIAHEALLSGWGTLKGWIDEQAGTRGVRERLGVASAEWERLGRRDESLWSARQLEEASRLDAGDLIERESRFVDASRRAVRRRLRTRVGTAVGVPLLVVATLAGVRLKALHDLHHRIDDRVAAADVLLGKARAQENQLQAARAEAFRLYDAGKTDAAESKWKEAQSLGRQTTSDFADADQAMEAAFLLDGTRSDVGRRVAEILYDRAVLAATLLQADAHDDLVKRLQAYDRTGEFVALLAAPAHLALHTTPPAASIDVERYDRGDDGSLVPKPVRTLGRAPIADLALPPGSWRLTFHAPDRVDVRFPLVVSAGESRTIDVPLPERSAIPPSFLYVPAGPFLYGNGDDEAMRQLLSAPPLHAVTTKSYLIDRYETTYDDWIAFLRALDPAERKRRLPSVSSSTDPTAANAVELSEVAGGDFVLSTRSAGLLYRPDASGALHYAKRSTHEIQPWRRLPVAGISWNDATAYAAWLAKSGKVPRARLCREDEWERAARGADGRHFPHGDALKADDANYLDTYGGVPEGMGPDAVGSHPASDSPFGLSDAVGNVYEMSASIDPSAQVVLRGGAFHDQTGMLTLSNRSPIFPDLRDPALGVRICADPPPGY